MKPVEDSLSQTFAALSDPTRRALLARLMQGEATVNELAAPFEMSLPAISKHIKVLEKAGLLIKARQAQQRPCNINVEQFRLAMAWFEPYRPLGKARPGRADDNSPTASSDKARPSTKKQAQSAEGSKKSRRTPRNASSPSEKEDDDCVQQQTRFDF